MNIRPLHDRLIVKREAEERKSPGGNCALRMPSQAFSDAIR
jgi:co-chaperonin GroES (HSP10)